MMMIAFSTLIGSLGLFLSLDILVRLDGGYLFLGSAVAFAFQLGATFSVAVGRK